MLQTEFNLASPGVAELQGLYGAFSFGEKLLQKIWLRGDFARAAARTTDGALVKILHAGKWNLLGGPDFLGARLRFDAGAECIGDVEVHLHASDWQAHGHAADRAYDRVALHVVLFPPDAGAVTIGAGARRIPVLVLLPLLHHALEEYAAEEAVEVLANRAVLQLPDELSRLDPDQLGTLLRRHAARRWEQKVHFARLRCDRLGWTNACHYTALEILGYRFNRAPMLRIAGQRPLSDWAQGESIDEAAYASERGGWSLQGVRPANQPRTRLRQYAAWARSCAGWPEVLAGLAAQLPPLPENLSTRESRRAGKFVAWRERIAQALGASGIAGSRFDTLLCDGFFPLLAARDRQMGRARWLHWFAGDLPPFLSTGLRQLGIYDGRNQPACHGLAQGLLGWLIERDAQCQGRSAR